MVKSAAGESTIVEAIGARIWQYAAPAK